MFSEATDVERALMKAECAKCMYLDGVAAKYKEELQVSTTGLVEESELRRQENEKLARQLCEKDEQLGAKDQELKDLAKHLSWKHEQLRSVLA